MSAGLPARHLMLALAAVTIWGTNFPVIKVVLAHVPPFTFATLRFALALFPALLFLPRPTVGWRNLAAYGLLIGAGQFGFLYIAIDGHISPGLASLVIQMQVFFTIGLAMWLTGERLRALQVVALVLAAGLVVIVLHTDGSTTALGVVLVLIAASGWAGGNLVVKQAGTVPILPYVVWSSAFAIPVLLVLALVFEGPARMAEGVRSADAVTWIAIAWQSWGNTLFGYAVWGYLLARHPSATISPIALLVPVLGMASSALFLAEPMPAWKLAAAFLVIAGLVLNLVPAMRR